MNTKRVAERICELTGLNMVGVIPLLEPTGMVYGYRLLGGEGEQLAEQILFALDSQPSYGKRGNYGFGFTVVMQGLSEDRRNTPVEFFPDFADGGNLPSLMREIYAED